MKKTFYIDKKSQIICKDHNIYRHITLTTWKQMLSFSQISRSCSDQCLHQGSSRQ